MTSRTAGIVTVVLVSALVSACSPARTDRSPSGAPSTPPAPSTPAPATGATGPAEMPDPAGVPRELRFTAPALGGGTIEGADHAGSDLVMWFWAPW